MQVQPLFRFWEGLLAEALATECTTTPMMVMSTFKGTAAATTGLTLMAAWLDALKKISRMKKRRNFRKIKWNSKTRNRTQTKRELIQN